VRSCSRINLSPADPDPRRGRLRPTPLTTDMGPRFRRGRHHCMREAGPSGAAAPRRIGSKMSSEAGSRREWAVRSSRWSWGEASCHPPNSTGRWPWDVRWSSIRPSRKRSPRSRLIQSPRQPVRCRRFSHNTHRSRPGEGTKGSSTVLGAPRRPSGAEPGLRSTAAPWGGSTSSAEDRLARSTRLATERERTGQHRTSRTPKLMLLTWTGRHGAALASDMDALVLDRDLQVRFRLIPGSSTSVLWLTLPSNS
jgi:hypothetical protein